jgi:LysM repeat protein
VSPGVTPDVVPPAQQQEATVQPAPALTHTVKAGEDTVSIAIMYRVSPSAVMDLNDLKNTDSLTPGQVLKLPANAKLQ